MTSSFAPESSCRCVVVVVTHNSSPTIQWCLGGLESATSRLAIRIVDAGSADVSYLDDLRSRHQLSFCKTTNVGFVAGNNLAVERMDDAPWILFLNPDARIEGSDLDALLALGDGPTLQNVGVLSVPLVRFDIKAGAPIPRYDSVGIGRTWYGRWIDLLAGETISAEPPTPSDRVIFPEAICGALMLTRASALRSAPDSTGLPGFERKYFMYKEDIELSLRLRRAGWSLAVLRDYRAYHCRGWNKLRRSVPKWARLESARNDVDIALSYSWRSIPFALAKLCFVNALESG